MHTSLHFANNIIHLLLHNIPVKLSQYADLLFSSVLVAYLPGSCYVLASYGDVANPYQPPGKHQKTVYQPAAHAYSPGFQLRHNLGFHTAEI
jgi:hypothetical protein